MSAPFVPVEEARARDGLRLVTVGGVPSPWSEAAKAIFRVKSIPHVRVRREVAGDNRELEAWTGADNAPVVAWEEERPRTGWAEILELAERVKPEPRLVPADSAARIELFGLAHEICGENGFGWCRRLEGIRGSIEADAPEFPRPFVEAFGRKYGYTSETAAAAPGRVRAILDGLTGRLRAQRERGSRFLLGDGLTALDLYWAPFAALLRPLPEEHCPMPPFLRVFYTAGLEFDPILLEHRDFVYREYLELPVDL